MIGEIKNLGKRKLKVIFKISLPYRKFITIKVSPLRLSLAGPPVNSCTVIFFMRATVLSVLSTKWPKIPTQEKSSIYIKIQRNYDGTQPYKCSKQTENLPVLLDCLVIDIHFVK